MATQHYSKWTKGIAASILAITTAFTPYVLQYSDKGVALTSNTASAAILAGELLSNVTLTNNTNSTAINRLSLLGKSHEVNFNISGKSLVEASTIGEGEKSAVLIVPDKLVGNVTPNGQATVDTAITLRLNEIAFLNASVTAVDKLLETIAALPSSNLGLVKINIDEVVKKANVLKNALHLTNQEFKEDITSNGKGEYLEVSLEKGLGQVLSKGLKTSVTDLKKAVESLNATPVNQLNPAAITAAGVINAALAAPKLALSTSLGTVEGLLNISNGNTVNALLNASVLGDTRVTIPTTIKDPMPNISAAKYDAKFAGTVVKSNLIDINLLKGSDGQTEIYYASDYDDKAPEAPQNVIATGNSKAGYELTGKAEPNSSIEVKNDKGEVIGKGKTDASGEFKVKIDSGKAGAKEYLSVSATDSNGNKSDSTMVKTPEDDKTPPKAPIDVTAAGNSKAGYELTGKAEPNSSIEVKNDKGEVIGKGKTDASGKFKVIIEPGKAGAEENLQVTATNEAGNTSEPAKVKTPIDIISGAITVDDIWEGTYLITGTAPTGTKTVRLKVNGHYLVLTKVKEDGKYSFERKYVYDKEGKKKLLSKDDVIEVDFYGKGGASVKAGKTTVQETVYGITVNAIEIGENSNDATNITGTVSENVKKVRLVVNGHNLQVAETVDGQYNFSRKYVKDQEGNKKRLGKGDTIRVEIIAPKNAQAFAETVVTSPKYEPVTIDKVDLSTFKVTGSTDSTVTKVSYTVNGKILGVYSVTDGKYTIERKYVYDSNGVRKILSAGDKIEVRNYSNLKDLYSSLTIQ